MLTREREDYLKTIYQLEQDASPVRTNSIAQALNLVPASVTGVIKQLAELNYLKHQPYKGVTLTDMGKVTALKIIRRHRLIELYLIEHLNYSWDEVHAEAERLEHAVSQMFVDRIETILGHPDVDPHGAPIPTRDGYVPPRTDLRLCDLRRGQSGTVSEVLDNDATLLRYLAEQGFVLGASVLVKEVLPYGGTILVQVDDRPKSHIGREAAENVFIALSES